MEDFLTVHRIKLCVARHFEVDVLLFADPTREQPVTLYRRIAMWFCRAYSDNSQEYIGSLFGGRDHSTVASAEIYVDDMINTSNNFRNMIFELKDKVEVALMIKELQGDSIDSDENTRI
jgi:chromosomal replication initiator protein